MSDWTFLSNHALALLCIAREPGMRIRDIADCVGITERAAHRIVCELEKAGYLSRHRIGRRNFYEIHADAPLRHRLEREHDAADVLRAFLTPSDKSQEAA
jgi:DNA-binding IclR family transcriptional regulator